jgi:hypothetical protein
LRSDYGTFRLGANQGSGGLVGVIFFLKTSWLELAAFLLMILVALREKANLELASRPLFWSASFLLSLFFLWQANVSPVGMGEDVLRRFHVMPLVQIALLSVFLWRQGQSRARVPLILVIAAALVLLYRALPLLDLRRDSVFEDYAANLLRQAEARRPAIVIADNDNVYFGVRYLQDVSGIGAEVQVISPSLFFHPWYLAKIQRKNANFRLPAAKAITASHELSVGEDIIEPNLAHFSCIVTKGYQDGEDFHVTFLGLGRVLGGGGGISFDGPSVDKNVLRTRYSKRPAGIQAFSKAALYSEYSHFFLARGLVSLKANQKGKATQDFLSALELVPFSVPALKNFCALIGSSDARCSAKNVSANTELLDDNF